MNPESPSNDNKEKKDLSEFVVFLICLAAAVLVGVVTHSIWWGIGAFIFFFLLTGGTAKVKMAFKIGR
jgi:hypothetical protein